MAQLTQQARTHRIQELLNELHRSPPRQHETLSLPAVVGEPLLCDVIKISVDDVLLNHQSHRLRAQLEDDPDWASCKNDPQGEPAQAVIARLVRDIRGTEAFKALKDSLERDGQTDAGVMTHDGVLLNANTRAVAIRELYSDPAKRFIRAAVLPASVKPDEKALLELRLQMQKDLKEPYTMTNELLFIEELSVERQISDAQIAQELRVFPESVKKGEAEVRLRLQMLDVIRVMQKIPDVELPLAFFDRVRYEQLRGVLPRYTTLMDRSPAEARAYLESVLLSFAAGVIAVHQIRHVDAEFMGGHMLRQLEEDEVVGPVADKLLTGKDGQRGENRPAGVDVLTTTADPPEMAVDVKGMINILTQRDKRVTVEGTAVTLEQDDVTQALKTAIIKGITEKKRDERDANKLEAPITALKEAAREMAKGLEAFKAVVGDTDFDQKQRKSLEAAFKRLKRTFRELEGVLAKANVIGE